MELRKRLSVCITVLFCALLVMASSTQFNVTTQVQGILPATNGGTGIAYFTVAGPTSAATYTFPTTSATIPQKVASGTSAMGTSAISAGACATAVTTAATNVATTDVVEWSFNASPGSTTGYSTGRLMIYAYPTAGDVNFLVCNSYTSSITPGSATLNWRVDR